MEPEDKPDLLLDILTDLVVQKSASSADDPMHRDEWLGVLKRAESADFILKLNGQQMTALLVIYFKSMAELLKEDGAQFYHAHRLLNAAIPMSVLLDAEFAEVHNVAARAALNVARSIIESVRPE